MKKRRNKLNKRLCAESISFQTHWCLKQAGYEETDFMHELASAEINVIVELDLQEDLYLIKQFVDSVARILNVRPNKKEGDFCRSLATVSMGIADIGDINEILMLKSWYQQKEKRNLGIVYPIETQWRILDWAMRQGYQVTMLDDEPIVHFKHLNLAFWEKQKDEWED